MQQQGAATSASLNTCSSRRPTCRLLSRTCVGRFAGDATLAFGARGGVYLGGGIAPRILDLLETGPFRDAFEDKGR
ncbi:MAG TPA: glucokinase [Mesorhizobium sp.]|nr:glucokinase [Mesorhizobium sp.]